jgi:magnesium chelatase subunit D
VSAGDSRARALAARDLAYTAAALVAVDPTGVGGIHLRARPGPELDHWTAGLKELLGDRPLRRMPPHIDAGRLTGELDLVASLREGRRVARDGLLPAAHEGVVVVPMAERLEREAGAILAEALDTQRVVPRLPGLSHAPAEIAAVLVDESREDEAGVAEIVQERMGCLAVLEPVGARAPAPPEADPERVVRARSILREVVADEASERALVVAGAQLGIDSLRPVLRASRIARAHAAWRWAEHASGPPPVLGDDDLAVAVALALLPRATVVPMAPEEEPPMPPDAEPPPPPPSDADQPDDADDSGPQGPIADRVVEAAEAFLPEGLVARFAESRARGTGRRGAKLRQLMHGHRVGARRGDPRRGGRVDLPATLRAAAPWQRARRAEAEAKRATGEGGGSAVAEEETGDIRAKRPSVHVRPSDLHVQERVRKSATATVFVVDASGSQALNRLAEVKGAVELFLGESYVRRDQVALVVFRGRDAQIVVPPTRSLVRVRRLLRGVAGGGGTPLAAGLEAGFRVALQLEASEASPRIVLLSDGRPNVGLDGEGGRERAREDALTIARGIGAAGIPALVLDSSKRGERFAQELAAALHGTVARLPRPDARGLRRALDLFGAEAT